MAAQKKTNVASFSSNSKIFSTNQSYVITCTGENIFLHSNESYLVLALTMKNFDPNIDTYDILRPCISWILQVNTTIQYVTATGPKIINYSGYSSRGIAGHCLELLEYSYAKYQMQKDPECLEPRLNQSETTFDAVIPLKFLVDPFYDDLVLNINKITFTVSYESETNIFKYSNPLTSVMCDKVDFWYRTSIVTNPERFPPEAREIPNRQMYMHITNLLKGSSSANSTPAIPFPCSVLYYFFVSTDDRYSLNPNPLSAVSQHSLTTMGEIYPLYANYDVKYDPGKVQTGLYRHYSELLIVSGKDYPERNTILTYTNWRDIYRIYSIELGTMQSTGQSMNFRCVFTKPLEKDCDCIMIFMGRDVI